MVGVYDTIKDKCYLVPVSATYQMTQRINNFDKAFGAQEINEHQAKNLSYYDQKQLTAQSFGTAKA